MHPVIHDDEIVFDGGAVRRRTATYGNGRVERWIEARVVDSMLGRRVQIDGSIDTGGVGRLLPDGIEMSVQHDNGLWSGVVETERILSLDVDALHMIRDGDASTLPDGFVTHDRFEIVGSICAYFGVLPDFDERGMRVSALLTEEHLSAARAALLLTPRWR